MGLKLFDDGGGGGSDGEGDKIAINQEFARRYEHNKKREDLQRLAERKKKGVIDLESDSESDESLSEEEKVEDAQFGKKKDLEFFDALIRVRDQDPVLKSKEAKLFESESESDDEKGGSNNGTRNSTGDVKKEQKKPMYLKDVMSKHLIEEGPEYEDDEDNGNAGEKRMKSYSEEQEELRRAFLEAVEEQDEDGEGGELLWEKIKSGGGDEDDEEDFGIGEKLDEYFGADDKLDEEMIFLKDYFRNRMWLGKGDDKSDEEGLEIGVSEDEEEIGRQEDYEREYNFRFEENAGDRVMGHSRVVEGSVRKKPNARKLQRDRKVERMAQAEFDRKEELKHLKNVKKRQMMEKLRKIREAAGIGKDVTCLLDLDDLEEEFNPDEYDKKMKETFDEGYYEAEDIDPDFGAEDIDPDFGSDKDEDGNGIEKPDFDKEDELLRLPKGWDDVNVVSDGFLSARERIFKQKMKSVDDHEPIGDQDDAISEDGKQKKNRKRKLRELEKAVGEHLMEEYHKLEYEDTIGDLKTRFKYRDVKPKRYGLSASEVLMMDDKELNQYVSIKKLAPYREKEWEVPRIKTIHQRQKNKLQLGASDVTKSPMKGDAGKPSSALSSTSREKPQIEKIGTSNLPRRIKRRRRQAELKLSRSRLMAYGKIPLKQKGKKKP